MPTPMTGPGPAPAAPAADLLIAVLLALVLLLVALYVWPGLLRIRAHDLAGFWLTPTEALYEITPSPSAKARFSVTGAGLTAPAAGMVTWQNTIQVDTPTGLTGRIAADWRQIDWASGEVWTRQGV